MLHILFLLTLSQSQQIVHTQIFGNSYDLGYYYVDLWVGTPPSKQTVIIDTGSSLTAFPCIDCTDCGKHLDSYFNYMNSSSSKVLRCKDKYAHCGSCESSEDLCRYSVHYAEGSSISGYLVQDSVIFGDDLNHTHNVSLVFGCHRRETHLFRTQLADGIMGLGTKGQALTIVDAMFKEHEITNDVFTICFADNGGFMTVGGYNSSFHLSDVAWVNMVTSPFYGIRANGLVVNGVNTGLIKEDFTSAYSTGTIVDSGTTFTYLCYAVYRMLYDKFDEYCKLPNKCIGEKVRVAGEPHGCYVYDNTTEGGLEAFFSTFPLFEFRVDDELIKWKPERYLFAWPESPNTFCVGAYNNGGSGNVLGGTFMRGKDVVFDRGNAKMGFAQSDCGVSWNESFGQARFLNVAPKVSQVSLMIFWKTGVLCFAIALIMICALLVGKKIDFTGKKQTELEEIEEEDKSISRVYVV